MYLQLLQVERDPACVTQNVLFYPSQLLACYGKRQIPGKEKESGVSASPIDIKLDVERTSVYNFASKNLCKNKLYRK